jgi:hypothetical protein
VVCGGSEDGLPRGPGGGGSAGVVGRTFDGAPDSGIAGDDDGAPARALGSGIAGDNDGAPARALGSGIAGDDGGSDDCEARAPGNGSAGDDADARIGGATPDADATITGGVEIDDRRTIAGDVRTGGTGLTAVGRWFCATASTELASSIRTRAPSASRSLASSSAVS